VPIFSDRFQAGRTLAERLKDAVQDSGAIVLALPRGGVPVGFEVAEALLAELDVFLARKLGAPGHEELAMGAVASGGVRVLNYDVVEHLKIPSAFIDRITAREQEEIERCERVYRKGRPPLCVEHRTAILVDDGLATGASMLAAARAVRALHPKRVIVGVPVASSQACEEFREHVDTIVCVATPEPFIAVGAWYEDFSQVSDAEVQALLERSARERAA
jgi:putative phosphoribosyl transferase